MKLTGTGITSVYVAMKLGNNWNVDATIWMQGLGGHSTHWLVWPIELPTSTRYSGIGDVVERTGQKLDYDWFITTELNWQNQVSSNKEKQKGFQEKVLQSPGFQPFLLMTKGSHFMRIGHSIAKFASKTQSNQELDGKVITFVGDRRARQQEPLAVILPQKAWTWATHKVYSKAKEMVTFYANKRNYGKFFVGTEEAGINVPFVLFIPLIAVKILDLHNKSKMSHECYSLIKAYILSPKTSLDVEHWGLVLDWLLTTSQGKEKKK
jgi:hypothetical protein